MKTKTTPPRKTTPKEKEVYQNLISNNVFTASVNWDAKATETIQTVADDLLNLTELFKSQHITMLNISTNEPKGTRSNI